MPRSDRRLTRLATCVRAPNPGPMTLDGTNTYVLRAPGSLRVVVVDPGPIDEGHLAEIERFGTVELILLTHRHHDHSDAVAQLAAKTGAVARAADERWCLGGEPLVDGERIHAAGTMIEVVATPGHTSDSVCFVLPDDAVPDGQPGTAPSILTGDTILGRGTTVIAHPDGSLADYLASLGRLRARGPLPVLPAHGPARPDLVAVCDAYIAHRHDKLERVQAVIGGLAPDPADAEVVERVIAAVYTDAPDSVLPAARASVRAQLAYLADRV
ncbi:MBL fold metallo-hydrolase [Microbacterium sp. NPDC056044]|uniref:MBL fold metallo-hydrolase n=1 Tax=Microbacterium sp. NPDC056044 TaxID=3345690 RepID=UPI0035D950F0